MAGTLVVSTISDGSKSGSTKDILVESIAPCRAMVTFKANADPLTIIKSVNVSSITDNSKGNYTVNFSDPMPSDAYAISWYAKEHDTTSTGSSCFTALGPGLVADVMSTTSCTIAHRAGNGFYDCAFGSFAAFC